MDMLLDSIGIGTMISITQRKALLYGKTIIVPLVIGEVMTRLYQGITLIQHYHFKLPIILIR